MDIHSICRICLEYLQNGNAYDLFLVPGLAKKLCMCTSLSVEPQDGFPKNICGVCYTRLSDMADFQKLCVDSVQKFQEMLANNTILCAPQFDIMEAPATAPIEGVQMPEDEDEHLNFDPLLTNHKMEMLENEEDVFKMLETVDKEEVEEVPTKVEEEEISDESSDADRDSDEDFQFPDGVDNDDDSDSDDDKPLASRIRSIQKVISEEGEKTEKNYEEHMKYHNDKLPFQCEVENCKRGFTTAYGNINISFKKYKSHSPSLTKKKPVEKIPYYRDEQREKDRLRRLYDRSHSRTPPKSSTARKYSPIAKRRIKSPPKRRRSTSRERYRKYSPHRSSRRDYRTRRSRSRTHSPSGRERHKHSSRCSRECEKEHKEEANTLSATPGWTAPPWQPSSNFAPILCAPQFDIMEAPATAPIEGVQMPEDEDEHLNFDPLLTNHKMEMLENEEDVFKMLETVDKEEVEEVPTKVEEEEISDESSDADRDSDEDFQFPDGVDNDDDSDSDDDKPLASRIRSIKKEISEEGEKTEKNYEEHMKYHNDQLPFQCEVENCKRGFTTAYGLRLHVEHCHDETVEKIPCTQEGCTMMFTRRRILNVHRSSRRDYRTRRSRSRTHSPSRRERHKHSSRCSREREEHKEEANTLAATVIPPTPQIITIPVAVPADYAAYSFPGWTAPQPPWHPFHHRPPPASNFAPFPMLSMIPPLRPPYQASYAGLPTTLPYAPYRPHIPQRYPPPRHNTNTHQPRPKKPSS